MSNIPRIYISYRYADGKVIIDRVYERLAAHFGTENVIYDAYVPGDDIRGRIREEVAKCDVILIFIGRAWLTIPDPDNPRVRRLDKPDDYVRLEIDTTLQRDRVRIIPVLIDGADMPRAKDLPESIRDIASIIYATIRDDPDFNGDVAHLIKAIGAGFTASSVPTISPISSPGVKNESPSSMGRGVLITVGLIIAVIMLFLLSQTGILNGLLQPSLATPTVLTGTGTPLPQGWISYQNRHTEKVFLETQDIPLENCNGNNPVSSVIKRDRSTTSTIELDSSVGIEAGLSAVIKASVSTQFNITEGETRSTSQEFTIAVNPGSLVTYELTWYETWQIGEILVANLNNLTIPYRVRTGLQAEVRSGTQQLCPALATQSAVALLVTPIPPTASETSVPPTDTIVPTSAPLPTTVSLTSIPANTLVPPSPTSIPATFTLIAKSYPCTAIVVNSGSDATTLSRVIFSRPDTTSTVLSDTLQVGQEVILAQKTINIQQIWYKLIHPTGGIVGWVADRYLKLTPSCPA